MSVQLVSKLMWSWSTNDKHTDYWQTDRRRTSCNRNTALCTTVRPTSHATQQIR